MLDRVAAVAVAVPFVVGTLSVSGSDPADGAVAFRFQDPAIVESSGLVVLDDGLVVTVNDSGDSGRVFVVDPASGETVGVTSWAEEPEDIEALAPAGPGEVWVGDIGDNPGSRDSITVLRVPVGRGDREVTPASYELVYPDGAHDAETLLSHPTTGRLYIATKSVLGGTLYEAPEQLAGDRPNRLEPIGRIQPIATDGSFLPSGDGLVLRDYGRAISYSFPDLARLDEVTLPSQRQGEGLAIGADGTAYISSEGRGAPVLTPQLPAVAEEPSSVSPSPSASASPTEPTEPTEPASGAEVAPAERPAWPWVAGVGAGLGVIVALVVALRRR